MNCNLPKITYPSFRSLLLLKFHKAICLGGDVGVTKRSINSCIKYSYGENSRILNAQGILKRVKKFTSVAVYRSAIALKLAAQTQRNWVEITHQLVDFCRFSTENRPEDDTEPLLGVLSDLTVTPIQGGLLECEFGDRAIAQWLTGLVTITNLDLSEKCVLDNFTDSLNYKSVQNGQDPIFLCQYTYARCHSLLQIAGELTPLNFEVQSGPLPWLTETGTLIFTAESDRGLLFQIVTTLDEGVEADAHKCLKLAVSLSHAFQKFYRNRQFFGDDRVKNLQLMQGRLGLVMITQLLLRSLLEEGLDIFLPTTL
jgi:hypothetical protein